MKLTIIRFALFFAPLYPASAHARPASPWNGTWTLDPARSSPDSKGAPDVYRFTFRNDAIRWEIPSMAEVVIGRTDGQPMIIRRPGGSHGMTLSVRAEGPATLRYRIIKSGRYFGGGLMTMVDDGRAWVDLTWGPLGPPQSAELVYVRKP